MEDEPVVPQCSALFLSIGPGFDIGDLRAQLETYGSLRRCTVPKKSDHNGKSCPKGYAFVKFTLASEAAACLEDMNGKPFGPDGKKTFVSVLGARKEDGREILPTLVCVKSRSEIELADFNREFGQFGKIKKSYYHKPKSVINVDYETFSAAAAAVENCSSTYKPYFVLPTVRAHKKRKYGDEMMSGIGDGGFPQMMGMGNPAAMMAMMAEMSNNMSMTGGNNRGLNMKPAIGNQCKVQVLFNPSIKKTAFTKLFNIVPGFVEIDFLELVEKGALATVLYDNPTSAEHAAERIHGLEYPPDCFMEVTLYKGSDMMDGVDASWQDNVRGGGGGLNNSGSSNSILSKDAQNHCNANLPSPQSIANPDSPLAKRLFFVMGTTPKGMGGVQQQQPPAELITNLFCRFGGLINASMIRGRRCGFVRYANEQSARNCMFTLNGALFMDRKLTVEVATEDHRPWDPEFAMQY